MYKQMPKKKWMEIFPEPGKNWKPIDERKEDKFYFMKDFLKILKDFIDIPYFETSYSRRDIIHQGGPSSEHLLKGRVPYRPFPVSESQPVDSEQKCEGVIYDVLAYYRQMRNKNWGIYYVHILYLYFSPAALTGEGITFSIIPLLLKTVTALKSINRSNSDTFNLLLKTVTAPP
jgi:hypothetical protein